MEGPVQGGPAGTDRAPKGWYRTCNAPGVFRTPDHPLQPLQGFRGPLRCLGCSLSGLGPGWVVPGIAPPVPTRYTRPRYPYWPPDLATGPHDAG